MKKIVVNEYGEQCISGRIYIVRNRYLGADSATNNYFINKQNAIAFFNEHEFVDDVKHFNAKAFPIHMLKDAYEITKATAKQ